MSFRRGIVFLVGAGPGDPGLITLRGWNLLRRADVIVHDRLIPRSLLRAARKVAEIIDVGKSPGRVMLPQEEINTVLIHRARAGLRVVRLKGGDPFVFGRGFEEFAACREAGVDCIVVPGVTSACAGPAAAGIPLTHRETARSFAVVTATDHDGALAGLDFEALSKIDTLVILMGRARLDEVVQALRAAGRDPNTPAACIEKATTPHQRVRTATLGSIVDVVERDGLEAPMVVVIGEVVNLPNDVRFQMSSPWRGKRVLVTRPASVGGDLVLWLSAMGVEVLVHPMIAIRYSKTNDDLDGAIKRLPDFDWVLFTSVHGVHAFQRRLRTLKRDWRSLAHCKVGAVGPATAKALRRYGIRPDLVPAKHTGEALADALSQECKGRIGHVLCPRSNIAPDSLPNTLKRAGAIVENITAYYTVEATLAPTHELRKGVDAILFFSPSAVRRFTALKIPTKDAMIVCLGPSTQRAAREAGLPVHLVASKHSTEGMLEALGEYDACCGVSE